MDVVAQDVRVQAALSLVAMILPKLGNERHLGSIPILQQPMKSKQHITRPMENRAKVFGGSRYQQKLAVNMPSELRVQRLLVEVVEDDHFKLSGVNGPTLEAHAEAQLVHSINQVLQPMKYIGKRYGIVSIHQ